MKIKNITKYNIATKKGDPLINKKNELIKSWCKEPKINKFIHKCNTNSLNIIVIKFKIYFFTINNNIPILKPVCTDFVCCPSKVPSLIISRHQQNIIKIIIRKPICNKIPPKMYPCIYIASPIVNIKAENAEIIGHGLGSTKWKLCFWLFLMIAIIFILKRLGLSRVELLTLRLSGVHSNLWVIGLSLKS